MSSYTKINLDNFSALEYTEIYMACRVIDLKKLYASDQTAGHGLDD